MAHATSTRKILHARLPEGHNLCGSQHKLTSLAMNPSLPRPPTICSVSYQPDISRAPSSSPPTPASASGEISFHRRPPRLQPSTALSIVPRSCGSPERAFDSRATSSERLSRTTETFPADGSRCFLFLIFAPARRPQPPLSHQLSFTHTKGLLPRCG